MRDKVIKGSLELLDNKKGENIIILDLRKVTTFTDYFIIVTGNSEVHCQAMARELTRHLKNQFKRHPLNPLEHARNNWILLDYQNFIVHFFTEESRDHYNLEELWYEAKRDAYPFSSKTPEGRE